MVQRDSACDILRQNYNKIIGISITDPDGTVISDDSLAEPDVLIAAENWIVWILTKITKSDISIMYQAKLRSKTSDE